MSRIGRMPITVPAGVEVTIAENNVVTVKGPKGTLTQALRPEMILEQEGNVIHVKRPSDDKLHCALHAAITPLLGSYLDHKGKGATMLIFGAVLMTVCHLIFAFVLPAYPSTLVAYGAIIILGISFSLVPAALWPSVPKIMETRYLGSAYSLIFWIQNIGLCLFPAVIGYALKFSNPGHVDGTAYNYTLPMVIFASCGIAAMLLGLWLKAEDRKKNYGLELPNIKK